MIEAWFETSHDPVKIIPVIVPSRDLSEIAESAGFESDELFSIEIPGGASRHTRIRVLVDVKDVPDLYSSAISVPVPAPTNNFSYPASALFRWRESSNAQSPLPKVLVWLKPPRPVFLYPTQEGAPLAASSRGVMSVEAVDCRYWWSRQRTVEYPVPTQTSMDERWVMTSAGDRIDITDVADDMVLTLVPGGEFIDLSGIIVGTNLSAAINEDRITNLSLQPDHSPAMQLDIALSAAGFMLVYNPAFDANYPYGRFTAIQIKDERSALAAWMTQDYGKRACAAGLEPTSAATTNLESLLDAWVGTTASQYHRVPERVEVLHRLGFVEGQTDYANAPNHFPIASNSWEPATQEGPGSAPVLATWSNSPELISTTRTRPTIPSEQPKAALGFESRGIAATAAGVSVGSGVVSPEWSYDDFDAAVAALLARRAEVCWGRVAWAGWPTNMPTGVYRGTMWRFSLASRNGQVVPICTTEASEQDWLFGASINPVGDIRDIVFPRGNVRANRLFNGALMISSAPPNCRIFPAKITASTRIGVSGDSYWQWEYEWVEVEPNPLAASPVIKDINSATMQAAPRKWNQLDSYYARNLAEHGNNYVSAADSANAIAPGVLQSSNPNATIEPLPISNGTVVMMCEHFLTLFINPDAGLSPPYKREYWFSMPNAINVSCTP